VLNIDLKAFKVNKGFLAQAKKENRVSRVCAAQGVKEHGFSVRQDALVHAGRIPISVLHPRGFGGTRSLRCSGTFSNPHEFYARSLSGFYEEQFECALLETERFRRREATVISAAIAPKESMQYRK
jgi:hypothetical protein